MESHPHPLALAWFGHDRVEVPPQHSSHHPTDKCDDHCPGLHTATPIRAATAFPPSSHRLEHLPARPRLPASSPIHPDIGRSSSYEESYDHPWDDSRCCRGSC